MRASLFLFFFTLVAHAKGQPQRIISLAPHTTEMTYALGAGDRLVAASDYSDYPDAAKALPRVADHNGVNFEAIMRLRPDLILGWRGGNKPQDLTRLQSLGFALFLSSPQTPDDIAEELETLGTALGQVQIGQALARSFRDDLQALRSTYASETPTPVFYYMWPTPLMSIGGGAWANHLLEICGARNVFADLPTPYPEVTVEQVLRRKPQVIVAAFNTSDTDVSALWHPWQNALESTHVIVDPDRLHRFSPRLIAGLKELCGKLN